MSRRLTIPTKEMGPLDLFLIYDYGGTWEPEWRPLQDHVVADLFTRVKHDTIEHAILGFSRPLYKALGLFPEGCLHKMPSRECTHMRSCSMYIPRDCTLLSKKMPVCFEPASIEEPLRALVSEIVRLWRAKVYVAVVEEPPNA